MKEHKITNDALRSLYNIVTYYTDPEVSHVMDLVYTSSCKFGRFSALEGNNTCMLTSTVYLFPSPFVLFHHFIEGLIRGVLSINTALLGIWSETTSEYVGCDDNMVIQTHM